MNAKTKRVLDSLSFESALRDVTPVESRAGKPTLEHLRWMLESCYTLVEDGSMDKANRWIGFIQGALWAEEKTTIDIERDRVSAAHKETST